MDETTNSQLPPENQTGQTTQAEPVAELTDEQLRDEQLKNVSGGRITNVRANVAGLGGGGLSGTPQLVASTTPPPKQTA